MDKLRALQYFNAAVEVGSFAAAARALDVSTPAVTQLIAALEHSLGATLFRRTTRGVSLTNDGERYHDVTSTLTTELQGIERQLGSRGKEPRGSLTVVMFNTLGQNCVMPHIGRFLARYPHVDLMLKMVTSLEEIDRQEFDVAVMTGWAPERDFLVRPLGQSRNVICASPEYWGRYGKPAVPEDLLEHHCLVFRSTGGAWLDRWKFENGGEQRTVNVSGRILSDSSAWADEAACAGNGVLRRSDFSLQRHLAAGALEAVLGDWVALDAPSHFALYRPGQRRSKPLRAFVDFLIEIFSEIQEAIIGNAGRGVKAMPKPEWFGKTRVRESVYVAHRRPVMRTRPAGTK